MSFLAMIMNWTDRNSISSGKEMRNVLNTKEQYEVDPSVIITFLWLTTSIFLELLSFCLDSRNG